MDPEELIRIALHLASGGVGGPGGEPRQAELRRAVSAAYYAMFHTLARLCANELAVGRGGEDVNRSWSQTYRSLEHGYARSQCEDQGAMSQFAPQIQEFADLFISMQIHRQNAEYNPDGVYDRAIVIEQVEIARQAIDRLASAPQPHRRAFALHVLLRRRR